MRGQGQGAPYLELPALPGANAVGGHPALALVGGEDVELVLQPVPKLGRLVLLGLVQVDLGGIEL